MRSCPCCAAELDTDGACQMCGWIPPKQPIPDEHRCCYAEGAARCPLPGTLSAEAYSPRDMWCRWHFSARGNPAIMHAILEDASHIPSATMSDWRASLLRERQTQLGLDPRPGETKAQLAVRSREIFAHFAVGRIAFPRLDAAALAEREAIQAA